MQVLDHGIQVEALEFLGVVERLAHRIGQRGVLVERMKVQLVRPPVTINPGQNGLVSLLPARNRASASALAAIFVHIALRSWLR